MNSMLKFNVSSLCHTTSLLLKFEHNTTLRHYMQIFKNSYLSITLLYDVLLQNEKEKHYHFKEV